MRGASPIYSAATWRTTLPAYAALTAPLAAMFAALATQHHVAALFSFAGLAFWWIAFWLVRAVACRNVQTISRLRWAPLFCGVLWIGALTLAASVPSAAKLAYSMLTLGCLIGIIAGLLFHLTHARLNWRQLSANIVAVATLMLWLVAGESDWYYASILVAGIPRTTPYLTSFSPLWWGACMIVPAMGAAWLFAGNLSASGTLTPRQPFNLDERTRRSLFMSGIAIILLMAVLQCLDFILPRIGQQIFDGDEFGYVLSAYEWLERGVFRPPHMPLISIYLAVILSLAGDSTAVILFANAGLVVATVIFVLCALWLISSDMRLVLLGGLLIVSLRTLYLYVWTPLSETLNTSLWAAAVLGLLAAVRRPTLLTHAGFGAAIGCLLLTRSQNLGGVLGLGLAYAGLLILFPNNRTALPQRRSDQLVIVLIVAAVIPLLTWGKYREITTGRFQIMDGRGADVLLGMNMPNVRVPHNEWTGNAAAWRAQHPDAKSADLVLAALRYRIERPRETLEYYKNRSLEFLNVRFALSGPSPLSTALKTNLQLVLALSASLILIFTPARWMAAVIWTIFIPFAGIFIAIYVEPRYRIPMDPLLTIGTCFLLAQVLFKAAPPNLTRAAQPVRHRTPGYVFTAVLAANIVLAVGIRAGAALAPASHSSFIAADLEPAGATMVTGSPIDAATYRSLPTWEDIIKTDDPASLQGKMFRARFGLVGNLFRPVFQTTKEIPSLHDDDEFRRAEASGKADGDHLKVDMLAVSFKGAVVEKGIKQRGVIELIGRVRVLDRYFSKPDGAQWAFIDALYVRCSAENMRQVCDR